MEQALADFAVTLDHIKLTEGVKVGGAKKSPVVGFGGSYGGMLCAWMRMKYPHKVIGLEFDSNFNSNRNLIKNLFRVNSCTT